MRDTEYPLIKEISFALNNGKNGAKVNKLYVEKTEGVKLSPEEYAEKYLRPRFKDNVPITQFLEDITYVLKAGKALEE